MAGRAPGTARFPCEGEVGHSRAGGSWPPGRTRTGVQPRESAGKPLKLGGRNKGPPLKKNECWKQAQTNDLLLMQTFKL